MRTLFENFTIFSVFFIYSKNMKQNCQNFGGTLGQGVLEQLEALKEAPAGFERTIKLRFQTFRTETVETFNAVEAPSDDDDDDSDLLSTKKAMEAPKVFEKEPSDDKDTANNQKDPARKIRWARPTHITRRISDGSVILVPVAESTQEEKEFLEMKRMERETKK